MLMLICDKLIYEFDISSTGPIQDLKDTIKN